MRIFIFLVIAAVAFIAIRQQAKVLALAMYAEGCTDVSFVLAREKNLDGAELAMSYCLWKNKAMEDWF